MGEQTGKSRKKQICIGLLAHVDAGKTTLSEALLYQSGAIRSLGRVDRRDAFLDTEPLERERGITIFAKQARFSVGETAFTLLDTPGHADLAAETERVLWALDYAVLVISAADGVQSHTETLWRLLKRHRIPVFLFINKMDQPGADREKLLSELSERLSDACMDIAPAAGTEPFSDEFCEKAALCSEAALEEYLECGTLSRETLSELIAERKLFPCCFGSALKLSGVDALLRVLDRLSLQRTYPEAFGARVFKLARDEKGGRLSFLKVTGGTLSVKMQIGAEKIDQIRLYDGMQYETVSEAEAGAVCAVLGLSETEPGKGLGAEPDAEKPVLEPVLSYRLSLPEGTDVYAAWLKLRVLADEDPELSLSWNEALAEIHVRLMGEVQTEILQRLIRDRFGLCAEFTEGSIVYKETIARAAEGIGHFEPLRHYAEVHLLLEPLPQGSGLVFAADCSEETLAPNWQRLVLSQLAAEAHPGVLTGSEVTDMKLTLISGRAHQKHTEGGDFREAANRALRQGLMQAESVLLEPYYSFVIELPAAQTGRAMTDIRRMGGSFDAPEQEEGRSILRGSAPVAAMRGYHRTLTAYTGGAGRLSLSLLGYRPCAEQAAVLAAFSYEPERDTAHPGGSVFCAHGAGFYVPWEEVPEHAHVAPLSAEALERIRNGGNQTAADQSPETRPLLSGKRAQSSYGGSYAEDRELEEIFVRTFGAQAGKRKPGQGLFDRPGRGEEKKKTRQASALTELAAPAERWLLVDGYNIIHAWAELSSLAAINFDAARTRLLEILANYQGYRGVNVLVVFDAYQVAGRTKSEPERWQNLYVVYTKQAETADQYIAKAVQEIGARYNITVATSDQLVQLIILGQGALRISARELLKEVEAVNGEIRRNYTEQNRPAQNYLLRELPEGYKETEQG